MSEESIWYYVGADEERRGPVGRAELLEIVRAGVARDHALVWRAGFEAWRPFRDVPELTGAPPRASEAQPAPAIKPSTQAPRRPPASESPAVRSAPRAVKLPVLVGAAFAALAIAVVAALYRFSTPDPPVASSAEPLLPSASFDEAVVADEEYELAALPVRVKNPFDATEVFEFPPGTSEADAREQVADLLLKRAADRRVQLKPAPKRRSKS